MNDQQTIQSRPRPHRSLPARRLTPSDVLEASADLSAPGPAAPPAAAIDDAIARTDAIVQRVRAQVLARLAFPWPFETYPLAELAEAPGDTTLEDLAWELEERYRRGARRPGGTLTRSARSILGSLRSPI